MSALTPRRRVLIMGAADRDLHHFLCCYRDNPTLQVPAGRVSYDIEEIGQPTLDMIVPLLAQRTRTPQR